MIKHYQVALVGWIWL